MWQMLRKRLGARDGFTLIELVVVVAILGLLAVVVTPKVMGAIDNARSSGQKSSAKQIQVALERYFAEKGAYPVLGGASGACGADYNAGTGAGCTTDELKTALGSYVNLEAANLDATTPVQAFTVNTTVTPPTYNLQLNFKGSGATPKLYTITADAITAAP